MADSRFGIRATTMRAASLVMVAGLLFTGCESMSDKQGVGTVLGGVLGGVLGTQLGGGTGRNVAIVLGAGLGGILGNVIGKQMDENDHRRMSQALEQNASGQSTTWTNDRTGAKHQVTPTVAFVQNGRQCRKFEQEAVVDGQPRKMSGTACKRADGENWEIST